MVAHASMPNLPPTSPVHEVLPLPIVMILSPILSFSAFHAYLFHALSHSFPTCFLTCHLDRHPIT